MTERFSKEALQEYGIFAGSIVLLGLLLSVTVIFSKGMWRNGLKGEVSRVLEESGNGMWRVGDFIELDSSLSLSAACFRATSKSESGYVCVVRMQTMYGPVPAVFILNERYAARFAGIAGLHGNIERAIENGAAKSQIRYWARRMSDIVREKEKKS